MLRFGTPIRSGGDRRLRDDASVCASLDVKIGDQSPNARFAPKADMVAAGQNESFPVTARQPFWDMLVRAALVRHERLVHFVAQLVDLRRKPYAFWHFIKAAQIR